MANGPDAISTLEYATPPRVRRDPHFIACWSCFFACCFVGAFLADKLFSWWLKIRHPDGTTFMMWLLSVVPLGIVLLVIRRTVRAEVARSIRLACIVGLLGPAFVALIVTVTGILE